MIFKKIFNFLLFSNIFIGLGAGLLVSSTFVFLGYNPIKYIALLFFTFSATVFVYTFHALLRFPEAVSVRADWIRKEQVGLKGILVLSLFLAAYTLFSLSFTSAFHLIPLTIIAILYSLKFNFLGKEISLKSTSFLKVFLIAFVWAYITVILPVLEAGFTFSMFPFLLFLKRFLLIAALAIPFDIRDVEEDTLKKINTIPVVFGIPFAKKIALLLLSLFLVLSISGKDFFASLPGVLFATVFILCEKKKGDYYYSFFGDGILIFYSIFFIGIEMFPL